MAVAKRCVTSCNPMTSGAIDSNSSTSPTSRSSKAVSANHTFHETTVTSLVGRASMILSARDTASPSKVLSTADAASVRRPCATSSRVSAGGGVGSRSDGHLPFFIVFFVLVRRPTCDAAMHSQQSKVVRRSNTRSPSPDRAAGRPFRAHWQKARCFHVSACCFHLC
eukprot:1684874-Rhodomonas_salina.3